MDDPRTLVEALRARDPGALASVYDAYAARLYAYCWFRLTNAEAAQVALRDTFIVAEAHADRLRDAEAFVPWLFALARAECARRPLVTGMQPDVPVASHDQRDVDQRLLAWRAVRALEPTAREALELDARHKLPTAHTALVLERGERQVQALLADAKGDLRRALTVEILSHLGAFGCAARADILAARVAGELDANVRANLLAHVKACPECAGHRPTDAVSPAKIFSMVPHPSPPASLRAKVMSCFTDPDLVGYRLFVATRSTDFTAAGFPGRAADEPVEAAPARGRRWRRILVVGTLSAGLVAGTTFVGWLVGDPRDDIRTIASGGTPIPRPTPSETVDDRPRPPAPRSGLVTATYPVGAREPATPEPIATPPAAPPALSPQSLGQGGVTAPPGGPGRISVSPLRLDMGTGSTGRLRLRADDDVVWRARVQGPIKLSAPSGRLAKDEQTTVRVRVFRTSEAGEGTIRIGGATVTVKWAKAASAGPAAEPAAPAPTGIGTTTLPDLTPVLTQAPAPEGTAPPAEPTETPQPTAVPSPSEDAAEGSAEPCPPEEKEEDEEKEDGEKSVKGTLLTPTSLSLEKR